MVDTVREARFALRRLVRTPVFSLTVLITMALGIGGTTAVYGLAHSILVKPLPYPEPDRLVRIHTVKGEEEWRFSMADYLALEEQQTSFEAVAAYHPWGVTLSTPEGAERLSAHRVTPGFFRVLGIRPLLGRPFGNDESMPGARRVAVVSWAFWQSRLGGDPGVLRRTIRLNQEEYEIVGVLSREAGPIVSGRDLLTNLTLEPPSRKGPFFLIPIGRLGSGVDARAAGEELRAISTRIFAIWQDSWPDSASTWALQDLKSSIVGPTEQSLWLVMGAVGFLLLIACTNAANLLVARAVEQRRELAVRSALGASRGRLLVHQLTDSTILALGGSVIGLGLATAAFRLVATSGAEFLPRTSEVGFTPPVLLFFALVSAGAFLVAGVAPALQTNSRTLSRDLRSGGIGTSAGRGTQRLRRALVGVQFAVTAPLLISGGLLLSSLDALSNVDPGFDPDRLLTVGLALPSESQAEAGRQYQDADARRQFWTDIGERVLVLPGVVAVGSSDGRPPDNPGFGNNFVLEDRPLAAGESQPSVPWSIASPGYFEALGVEQVAGRMFDMPVDPPRVALVDEAWARRFFDDAQAAVGRRFLHGGCTVPESCEWWTVIGVVADVDYNGLSNPNRGVMYLDGGRYPLSRGYLVVRTATAEPERLLPAIRQIIHEVEPGAPIIDPATGTELLRDSLRQPRYLTGLVGAFGSLALILALVGTYGVMAYFVEQHRRDIGIRLALGSESGRVRRLVVGSAVRIVLLGTAVGIVAAFILTRFLEGVLYGVGTQDPATYGLVFASLVAAATLAAWIPARRAAATDPMRVLRME